MTPLLAFCLLSLTVGSSAQTKNALYGFDVLMHSDPNAPRLVLVNDEGGIFVNVFGAPAFTWCVYLYLEEKEGKSLATIFGYGSKEHAETNEILLEMYVKDGYAQTEIRGTEIRLGGVPSYNEWSLVCLAWSGETGIVDYYLNGKLDKRVENHDKGQTIGKDGVVSVGQDQDGYDTGYAAADGIYGKMTQFNAWDRALNEKEVQLVQDGKLYGNRVDWRTSTWAMAGNAILLPTDTPNAALQKAGCQADEKPDPTDLTISLRFKGDSVAQETLTLFYYINSYGSQEFALAVNATRATSAIIGIEERQLPHLTVSPGWQHWCFVWSNNMLEVYIDGGRYDTLTDFADGTQMSTNGDLYIQEENSRKRVKAQVADVKLWERALTAGEVSNEYRAGVEYNEQPKTYLVAAPVGVSAGTSYVRRYWQPNQVMTYTF